MREVMTNLVMMAVTVAWLVPFYQIVTEGQVWAAEPNLAILSSEIVVFIAIIVFGGFNLGRLIRR